MVADTLTLTFRLLMLTIGEVELRQVLGEFWNYKTPNQVPLAEARCFAEWLGKHRSDLFLASEVAAFEVATREVRNSGRSQTVNFSQEPLGLLRALGEGRLQAAERRSCYELVVEA